MRARACDKLTLHEGSTTRVVAAKLKSLGECGKFHDTDARDVNCELTGRSIHTKIRCTGARRY